MSGANPPHLVCFLISPGIAAYDVAGPAQALSASGPGRYKIVLASVPGGSIESDCAGVAFGSVSAASLVGPIDTLFILGGIDTPASARGRRLIKWVERLAARASRVACVCTGAFLAAEAGLLAGRHVATHWEYCDEFEQRFKDLKLQRDPIWIKDGRIWTSAGISAGVDLTLALIEEDLGIEVALQVARRLVVFFKRPGGQSQFSTVLSGQIADAGGPLSALLAWMADNLGSDLRPQVLAEKSGMTLRTFARSCASHTGHTPTKLVEMLRVQAAREAIERGEASLDAIAARFGFGEEQRMRRAFVRQIQATPADIRARSTRPRSRQVPRS